MLASWTKKGCTCFLMTNYDWRSMYATNPASNLLCHLLCLRWRHDCTDQPLLQQAAITNTMSVLHCTCALHDRLLYFCLLLVFASAPGLSVLLHCSFARKQLQHLCTAGFNGKRLHAVWIVSNPNSIQLPWIVTCSTVCTSVVSFSHVPVG